MCGYAVGRLVDVADGGHRAEGATYDLSRRAVSRDALATVVEGRRELLLVPSTTRDEVDDATYSVRPVQSRSCATDQLDTLDIGHIDAVKIHHSIALRGQSLAVDKEEDVIA